MRSSPRCAAALGLDALAADPRARDECRATRRARAGGRHDRRRGAHAARRALDRAVSTRAGVPCGPVKPVLEALRDVAASPLTGVAPLAPGTVRLPPPRLDEHGALVRAKGWAAFVRARIACIASPRVTGP